MSATGVELLDLVARWVHVIAGIMWIGNSLLFNWLDRSLRPGDTAERGLRRLADKVLEPHARRVDTLEEE